MSEFRIKMRRAPGISEDERRRRMHKAYSILLEAARRKRAADRDEATKQQTRPAAEDIASQEADVKESIPG